MALISYNDFDFDCFQITTGLSSIKIKDGQGNFFINSFSFGDRIEDLRPINSKIAANWCGPIFLSLLNLICSEITFLIKSFLKGKSK